MSFGFDGIPSAAQQSGCPDPGACAPAPSIRRPFKAIGRNPAALARALCHPEACPENEQDRRMLHHTRLHPHVHLIRWRAHRAAQRVIVGLALILLGIGYLLRGQGLISTQDLWLVAPLVIALSGLVRLVGAPGIVNAVRALLRLAVAAYLVVVIEHIGGWTLAATWPVLLIAVGAGQITWALFGRRLLREGNW